MPALLRMQQSQNTAMPSAAPPASAERGISLQTMHMDLELQGHMPVDTPSMYHCARQCYRAMPSGAVSQLWPGSSFCM